MANAHEDREMLEAPPRGEDAYLVPLAKSSSGNYDGYQFSVNAPGSPSKASFVASSDADRLVSTTDVDDGVWHHLAVTLNPEGDMVLYVDGSEEARRPAPVIRATPVPLRFGALTKAGVAEPLFVGQLDEIQIHHTVLDGARIEAISLDPSREASAGRPFDTGVSVSVPSEDLGVAWRSIPGWTYQVQRSETLVDFPWPAVDTVTPTSQVGLHLETEPSARAFFRVEMNR
jgi:hypothetical protein